jgi:hypothetical protein
LTNNGDTQVANCWIEINTGAGEYFKVEDFGQVTTGMQVLLNLAGIGTLLTNANTDRVDAVGNNCQLAISMPEGFANEQLRQIINTLATTEQIRYYEPLENYLENIREAGLTHPLCVFRCVAGISNLIQPLPIAPLSPSGAAN